MPACGAGPTACRNVGAMARLSLRDRFFTPPVAKAMVSPSGILLVGAGAAVGIVAGLPIVAAAALGGAAWAARVGFAIPRNPRSDRIDPFALQDPWRTFVRDAQQSASRFDAAVRNAKHGPLRDRLGEIRDRLDTGVHESWRIARSGQALADARSQIDLRDITYQLSQVNGPVGTPAPPPGSAQAQTIQALQAQLDTVARLDDTLSETVARLRLLDARIDESVTRAIELSVRAERTDDLGGLSADVDSLVGELESLRQALDDTEPRDVVLPDLTLADRTLADRTTGLATATGTDDTSVAPPPAEAPNAAPSPDNGPADPSATPSPG